jgi:hypothetical protein
MSYRPVLFCATLVGLCISVGAAVCLFIYGLLCLVSILLTGPFGLILAVLSFVLCLLCMRLAAVLFALMMAQSAARPRSMLVEEGQFTAKSCDLEQPMRETYYDVS